MKQFMVLFLLMAFAVQSRNITPADGLWGTTDNPAIGSGLMLTTQGGITVVSVFTYDAEGQNVWYLASGQVNDAGVFEADLLHAQNGSHILNENPASAEFIDSPRKIRLEFTGSQIGTLSIGESEPKAMQASHFGIRTKPTEQLVLADETEYQLPYLDGQWVLGDPNSRESYVLDFIGAPILSPPNPNRPLLFYSVHPSTDGWEAYCPLTTEDSIQPYCRIIRNNDNDLPELKIDLLNLGNQRMPLYQNDVAPFENYQAFRLNSDRRVLPNDGYWRPADDPDVGSGLVMRTQGDFTVVLMYSYDEEGKPAWQIASGQFDENGKLVAELLTTQAGGAIESAEPISAEFSSQISILEIQLQGTELATFSLDGSEPKYIQNLNFGIQLHKTEMLQIDEEHFLFPDQEGHWVLVDDNMTITSIWEIERENPNCCQTPPDPQYLDSVGYTDLVTGDDGGIVVDLNFVVHFNCVKSQIPYSNYPYPNTNYCYGRNYSDDENELIKIYFEDISVNQFRYYIGPRDPFSFYVDYELIDRNSKMYQLFKLSTD